MTNTADAFGGRWVVVTGASSGLGRAISVSLVSAGARVVLVGRREERLRETAELAGAQDRTTILSLDLAEVSAIQPAIKALASRIGRIYGMCHAAGTSLTLPLSATKPERARAVMEINFLAGLEVARAVTERATMTEDGGSLVWVSSVYAHVGAPGQIAYCASKGAIGGAVRAMAAELAPRRIRVNAISPGLVRTDMTDSEAAGATGTPASRMTREQWARIESLHPLGIGEPADVARAALFMLHPANAWITGADLVIDGGYSLQ